MRKLLSLLIIALACTTAQAQVPGYMGLKCSIQYQGGISPQWNDFAWSHLPYFTHNVQLDYVLTRRHSIGIQYTRLDYGSDANRILNGTYDYYTSQSDDISYNHRKMVANNVSVYVKFFRERKGFIAPLGRYFVLGLTYQNTKDVYRVYDDATSPVGVPYNCVVQSHDVGILAGVGRNIILANRLLISIEGDINIPFTSAIRAGRNQSSETQLITHTGGDPFKYQNAVDVMLINLVSIKIGIGALIF